MNAETSQRTSSVSRTPGPAVRHLRRWLPLAGALLLVGLILAGLWPKPISVELAQPAFGALRATINEEGKTRIKQRFVVSAPVTGQLRRIPFKAGTAVQARETVAVIEPISPSLLDARSRAAAEARRDVAQANLDKATTAHDYAASELRRFQKLFKEQTISVQEREAAELREASAAREKAAAQSSLRQVEAELAEFSAAGAGSNPTQTPVEVKAPAQGSVLHVFEENARVVSAGAPLMQIGDPADLEVVIEVLSRDGAAIMPGTKVELEQWGGGAPLQAKVRLVEPAAFTKVSALGVEEQRVNVVADILAPAEQRRSLGDNFRVESRIVMWEKDRTLKVPSGALFRKGEQWHAFVVVDGRARLQSVKVGQSSGTETEVLEGLKEGDQLVLYPGDRLRDGVRVVELKM